MSSQISGAEGENRTRTLFPEPDFESGASTSSATPANLKGAKVTPSACSLQSFICLAWRKIWRPVTDGDCDKMRRHVTPRFSL